MDFLTYIKELYPSLTVSDTLLNSFIFQGQLTLQTYGIQEKNSNGEDNLIYKVLLSLFIGCELQKLGYIEGGQGAVNSAQVKDFSIGYNNLIDKYKGGVPNAGGYCDMFNYLAQQESLANGALKPFFFYGGRGGCKL